MKSKCIFKGTEVTLDSLAIKEGEELKGVGPQTIAPYVVSSLSYMIYKSKSYGTEISMITSITMSNKAIFSLRNRTGNVR